MSNGILIWNSQDFIGFVQLLKSSTGARNECKYRNDIRAFGQKRLFLMYIRAWVWAMHKVVIVKNKINNAKFLLWKC